jgi:hypothetical protein
MNHPPEYEAAKLVWTSSPVVIYVPSEASPRAHVFLGEEDLGTVFEITGTSSGLEEYPPDSSMGLLLRENRVTRNRLKAVFPWGTLEVEQYELRTTTPPPPPSPSLVNTTPAVPQFVEHGHDLVLNNRLIMWEDRRIPENCVQMAVKYSCIADGVLARSTISRASCPKNSEYLVYVQGKKWPTTKHPSTESAEAEAKRLLGLEPDKEVHVIRHHCTYKYVRTLKRTD